MLRFATLGVGLAAAVPAEGRTCNAEIQVRGASVRGPRFGFVFERSHNPLQVYAITVKLVGEVVCQVATPRREGFRPYIGEWTYGDVPPGFVVDTVCAPLVVGKRYGIQVVGSCLGSTSFTFDGAKK